MNSKMIPQFYFPGQRNCAFNQPEAKNKLTNMKKQEIQSLFLRFPRQSMQEDSFLRLITTDLLQLPSFCNSIVMQRVSNHDTSSSNNSINSDCTDSEASIVESVTCSAFLRYWANEVAPYDATERLFRLLKQPESEYLDADDMLCLVQEVVNKHPGLASLRGDHFCKKYLLTVVTRFFYAVNTSRTGKISLREFRHQSQLLQVLRSIDTMGSDINEERRYFSYEHFMVLYCTFLDLDHDHDGVLHIREIQRYQRFALTPIVVNRLYLVGEKALSDGVLGFRKGGKAKPTSGLSYADFIYLYISDIDKTTSMSLRYWFRCFDLDGNGILTQSVLERMYKNQHDRLIVANKDTKGRVEAFSSHQMLEYLLDKLNPNDRQAITIDDFISYSDQLLDSGNFFNGLSNMGNFLQTEEMTMQETKLRQNAFLSYGLSDWDRHAIAAYNNHSIFCR